MSEAVFDDTPLGEYLSDVGIEDWGIDETPAEPLHAPQIELRPLKLTGSSNYTGEAQFRSLIRSALLTELPQREVCEFLDQFRYQIISSNLLEERPMYATWSRSTAERRIDLLFNTKGPWDMLRIPAKYWVGGGGCVVLIVSLFSLKLPQSGTKFDKISLVGTLLIALYLFAHSRRRIMRLLQRKALGQVCLFVHQQKLLDGDCVRALRSIQQSDAMSPRGARKLRSLLCSCFHLLTEQYCDAIKDCLCMCSELDLQRYWEIYDLTRTQQRLQFIMNDDFIGFEQEDTVVGGGESCYASIAMLKLKFQKVHFLRRAFLCCLLTASSSGKCTPQELEGWTVITDHLTQTTDFSTQICNLLTKERLDPRFKEHGQTASCGDKSAVSLNLVSQHIATRMDILTNTALTSDEYEQHIQQLNEDITTLNQLWAKKQGTATITSNTSLLSDMPSTPETLVNDLSAFSEFSLETDPKSNCASPLNTQKDRPDLSTPEPFQKDLFMNELTRALQQRQ